MTVVRYYVGSAAMLAGALVCVLVIGSLIAQIVGILGVAFFGLAFLWMTWRVVRPRPIVVLSHDGFFDWASLFGCGFVPWSNVKKAHVSATTYTTPLGRAIRQKFVVIPFRDLEAGLARLPGWKQVVFRFNARLGFPMAGVGAGIPASQLPMTAEAFAALVNEWAAQGKAGER